LPKFVADPAAPEPIRQQFPRFFADEVIPFVSARYRVCDEAAHPAIGGVSLGGAAALYVALRHPHLFGLALLQSPTLLLSHGQSLRDTTSLARGPDRMAIGVGAAELDVPNIEQWPAPKGLTRAEVESAMVGMAQSLASNLKGAHINHPKVLLVIEPKANHSSVFWAHRMPEAIKFLFEDSGSR
jgi:enterochelin esterase-like enzyme